MINKKRLILLLKDLIGIDSQNPPGNERRIAEFIKDYLAGFGVKAQIREFKKNRSNLIAYYGGNNKSLLITPHLDTVPAGKSWKFPALTGLIRGKRIYGLGATDCKVNLACAIETLNSLAEDKVKLDYKIIFAATADEESGSDLGLTPLLNKRILKPDAALVLDSDDFSIIVTQKGLIHLKVKVEGKKAHGAYPKRGINAIDAAVNIIKDAEEYKFKYRRDPYLKPPTLNVGTICGGDKVNVVADWCEFELDFRYLPGSNAADIISILRKICLRHTRKFRIEIQGIQQPYRISEQHQIVRQLKRAMKRLKVKPCVQGSEGATVITFFQHKSIPAVATGFGSEGCAHAADEFVKIDNLYKGALVLEKFLKNYSFS